MVVDTARSTQAFASISLSGLPASGCACFAFYASVLAGAAAAFRCGGHGDGISIVVTWKRRREWLVETLRNYACSSIFEAWGSHFLPLSLHPGSSPFRRWGRGGRPSDAHSTSRYSVRASLGFASVANGVMLIGNTSPRFASGFQGRR
jgi:hypothetical protein